MIISPTIEHTSEYTLHRSPGKHSLYNNQEIWWSDALSKWMCTNMQHIEQILSDKNFRVHSYSVKALESRLDISLPHISELTQYFPLAIEGTKHKEIRKENALNLANKFKDTLVSFESSLSLNVAPALFAKENINLVKEIIDPSLRAALITLSGLENIEEGSIVSMSQMFDQLLNIKQRIKIDAQIARLLDSFESEIPLEEKYFRIAVFAIGYDSLLGSMTESIGRTLLNNSNLKLSDIPWSEDIPCSGAPVIERVAIADCIIGEKTIRSGQKIRLYLESAGFNGSENSSHSGLFFGHGIHKCIAVHLSNAIWKVFVKEVTKIDQHFSLKHLKYRKNDYVFNVFDDITVDIYD